MTFFLSIYHLDPVLCSGQNLCNKKPILCTQKSPWSSSQQSYYQPLLQESIHRNKTLKYQNPPWKDMPLPPPMIIGKQYPGLHYGRIITMIISGDINMMTMANPMRFILTGYNSGKEGFFFAWVEK